MRERKIKTFVDQKAFILGGSGLIGSEVIKVLTELGCKTYNLDIKKNNKENDNYIKFDLTRGNIKKSYSKIINKFGLPDIFINCAYPKTSDWEDNNFSSIKLKSLKKNIENHITNTSFLIREVAECNKKKKKSCSIILLSSIYGLVGQDNSIYKGTDVTENMTYSLIKSSIINFTKQMSSHYSRYGIRTNCVCPGGVYNEKLAKNLKYKKLLKNYSIRSPIGRMARPNEIAEPIVFLASNNSSYISGISLIVDGGWTAI